METLVNSGPTISVFAYQEIEEITIVETPGKVSMKGLTGHWSKWGGRRYDYMEANQHSDNIVPESWYCQSCCDEQPHDFAPYKVEYPEGEWIRVCAICLLDGCQTLKERVAEAF